MPYNINFYGRYVKFLFHYSHLQTIIDVKMDKKYTKSSFIVLILTALIVFIESAPAPSINHAEVS